MYDNDTQEFITDEALASMLQISVRTLQRHIEDAGFPKPMYIGRARRWSKLDVCEALRKCQDQEPVTDDK